MQAVNNLRTAILDSRFQPGERLVERRLCELLGVSRTLVREALRQLEAEGWVDNESNRGPSVAVISAKEAGEIYQIRGALEGLAAQLFTERASDVDMAALAGCVNDMQAAVEAGDRLALRNHVESFYDALLKGAGNAVLWTYVRSQRARLTQLRALSLSQPERPAASLAEKRELLAALLARDARQACRITERHLHTAAQATAMAIAKDIA